MVVAEAEEQDRDLAAVVLADLVAVVAGADRVGPGEPAAAEVCGKPERPLGEAVVAARAVVEELEQAEVVEAADLAEQV